MSLDDPASLTPPGSEEESATGAGIECVPPHPRSEALLDVDELSITLDGLPATSPLIDRVSFRLHRGRTLALVGESGCGKSLTVLSILRLLPRPPFTVIGGRILWRESHDGAPRDLLRIRNKDMENVRGGRIGMIFQEPMTALHPLKSIGKQMLEGIELHRHLRGRAAQTLAREWLARVGLTEPHRRLGQYPHEFSGGMLQRATIAMALACAPALLIADEPTTALDVTVQAGILDLLRTVQSQTGMAMLLVTHDLGVVANMAHDVAVMYAGRIVETGPTATVLSSPAHPYTQALIGCVPRLSDVRRPLMTIPGRVPQPQDYLQGCRFAPRCGLAAQQAHLAVQQGHIGKTSLLAEGQRVPERCAQGDGITVAPALIPCSHGHCVACWEVEAAPTATVACSAVSNR